jgi:hypothetical protein
MHRVHEACYERRQIYTTAAITLDHVESTVDVSSVIAEREFTEAAARQRRQYY